MRVVTIILGVLLFVGGIYCIITPISTYASLSWLIGLAMVIEGVGDVIMWNDWRKQGLASGWTLLGAIVSIVLGVFLLGSYVAQFAVDMFIAILIAVWLIVAGVTRIAVAISARSAQDQMGAGQTSWGGLLALGIIITILGVLCFFNPLAVMAGVGMMLGISIAFVGAGLVIRGARM